MPAKLVDLAGVLIAAAVCAALFRGGCGCRWEFHYYSRPTEAATKGR